MPGGGVGVACAAASAFFISLVSGRGGGAFTAVLAFGGVVDGEGRGAMPGMEAVVVVGAAASVFVLVSSGASGASGGAAAVAVFVAVLAGAAKLGSSPVGVAGSAGKLGNGGSAGAEDCATEPSDTPPIINRTIHSGLNVIPEKSRIFLITLASADYDALVHKNNNLGCLFL